MPNGTYERIKKISDTLPLNLLEKNSITPCAGFCRLDWNSHLTQMVFSLKYHYFSLLLCRCFLFVQTSELNKSTHLPPFFNSTPAHYNALIPLKHILPSLVSLDHDASAVAVDVKENLCQGERGHVVREGD